MSRRFSQHFSVAELACRDGKPVPLVYYDNAVRICNRAEVLRAEVCKRHGRDTPLIVLSGYRTKAHNKAVGGAKKSFHLRAKALDLRSPHYTAAELADIYEELVAAGKVSNGGLGRYPGFIHIDLGTPRRWEG